MLLQVTASSLDRMTMPSPHRLWPVHICGSKELPHMQHTATARRSTGPPCWAAERAQGHARP